MAAKPFSLADAFNVDPPTDDNNGNPLSEYFDEVPVSLEEFMHGAKYLNQPKLKLGEYQYNLIRHMEQVYLPEMYPLMVEAFGDYWEPVRYVNRLNVQWGKGSGKDMSVQIAVARIAYLLLCLKSPQDYFGLSEQSDIHILNVAMNAPQARRAFFKPLGSLLKRSPWFKDKILNDITDMGTSIRLDKQIELISGHSQVENFEGLSPIVVVLDEISGFQSEEQKASRGVVESQRTAEAVYEIVKTSASTRFPYNYKLAAISYPRYLHDPIQNLCAAGMKDIEENGVEDSIYYVDGPRATWEVNPRISGIELIKIPETDRPIPNIKTYIEDYKRDAAGSRAKYECRPERAANRYLRNDSAIMSAFPKQDENWIKPIDINYYWGFDREGAMAEGSYELAEVPGWQVHYTFGPSLKPMEGSVYAVHVDLAVTADKAGIAMCHVKNWERREHRIGDREAAADYQIDDRPIVKVDFVTYYEADMQALTEDEEVHPREIQLRWARNLIRELRRQGFPIGSVTFDTYQSTDSIQILEMWGIPADNLSMDRNIVPYATLREIMYDNRLEGYHDEILQIELESLSLLPNGKVDHPPGGSKDLADAICGAVTGALLLGGDEGSTPEEIDLYAGMNPLYAPPVIHDPVFANINLNISPSDLNFSNSW